VAAVCWSFVTTTHAPVGSMREYPHKESRLGTMHHPHVTRPLLHDAVIRRPAETENWSLHPDSVALALESLRALERAVSALIDSLDVTGFPESERRSEIALLSHVASGLPPVTLNELVDSLYHLARVAGPRALFLVHPSRYLFRMKRVNYSTFVILSLRLQLRATPFRSMQGHG